ncbi:MAG TPA: hypothetical protein VJJ55_01410 [Candidatus Paceibacterota bacterium]
MNIETEPYENFLKHLGKLRFRTVQKVLKRRDDLTAFRARNGRWTTLRDPWFGDAYAELSEAERERADLRYRYYCGHADDIFYRSVTRSDKQTCFLPAFLPPVSREIPPLVGDIIFGHVEEDGPQGPRFIWWNAASAHDRNFANLLSGRASYSSAKLEKKLVLQDSSGPNWKLFLLAKALHFRDANYFADQVRQYGAEPQFLRLRCPLAEWLERHIGNLLPEFLDEFRRKLAAPP